MLSSLFSSSTQSLAGEEGIFRKRAVSMKNLSRTANSTDKVNTLPVDGKTKYATVSKRYSDDGQKTSVFTLFQTDKKKSNAAGDDAMAQLDAQIAKIRHDLDAMRLEGITMGQRVASVSAGVNEAVSRHSSLEMIEESNTTTTSITKSAVKGSSMSLSSCGSKRDSGFVYDPAFEMIDPHKYCLPNNLKSASLPSSKKCRSTTALDFIRNDLHNDQSSRLKATSIDRISCYSDSAILTMSVYGRHHASNM